MLLLVARCAAQRLTGALRPDSAARSSGYNSLGLCFGSPMCRAAAHRGSAPGQRYALSGYNSLGHLPPYVGGRLRHQAPSMRRPSIQRRR